MPLALTLEPSADVARRDPLTGLPARAAFAQAAEQLLTTRISATVLMLDLVDFKAVNDRYGHAAGDAVLAAVGARLADWAGPGRVSSRLGGDEFAALADLPPADLPGQLNKLRTSLERPSTTTTTTRCGQAAPTWSKGPCGL